MTMEHFQLNNTLLPNLHQTGNKACLILATKPSNRALNIPIISCLTELALVSINLSTRPQLSFSTPGDQVDVDEI
jgi:hypothetical protein